MIIGPCGAGKSTASSKVAKLFDLPLFHMDKLNWKPGWVESETEELRAKVAEVAAKERWVIEGNYGSTMELRLPRADLILYLDYPIPLCLYRIVKRYLQYRGRTRPDLSDGCEERLDPAFLLYVARWNSGPRLRTEAKIEGYEDKIVRLASPKQLDQWLAAQPG